jgi:hypothetical protein
MQAATGLGTEAKVVGVHARVENVQDIITIVRGRVVDVYASVLAPLYQAR